MTEIPEWIAATRAFRELLLDQGQPGRVRWVFREEIYQPDETHVLARRDVDVQGDALAARVFTGGREKGLVEIVGIAACDDVRLGRFGTRSSQARRCRAGTVA